MIGFLFLPQGISDPKQDKLNVIINVYKYITTSISISGVKINKIIVYMTSSFTVGIFFDQSYTIQVSENTIRDGGR